MKMSELGGCRHAGWTGSHFICLLEELARQMEVKGNVPQYKAHSRADWKVE